MNESDDRRHLSRDVEKRAYFLWEQAGRPDEAGWHFWLQAEGQITNERARLSRLSEKVKSMPGSVIQTPLTETDLAKKTLKNVVKKAAKAKKAVKKTTKPAAKKVKSKKSEKPSDKNKKSKLSKKSKPAKPSKKKKKDTKKKKS